MSAGGWRPSASLEVLHARARALTATRTFFARRGVMEVETPCIVGAPVSDVHLANVPCHLLLRSGLAQFLHTSPEYHMKRLLAAGAPDIYQVCKVFRDGEHGARHLPEFTMVEWYRRGLTLGAMIGETAELVATLGDTLERPVPSARRYSYRDLFLEVANLDPLEADAAAILRRVAELRPGLVSADLAIELQRDREACLDLVMVEIIEPALRAMGLVAIERFPAQQAALARLDAADPRVAERFEVYLHGVELANGFHELADAGVQRERFAADRARRASLGLPDVAPDEALLAALSAGLPDCCGVALGFDRVLMACLGLERIDEVVSFPVPESN